MNDALLVAPKAAQPPPRRVQRQQQPVEGMQRQQRPVEGAAGARSEALPDFLANAMGMLAQVRGLGV